jgi:hypothetical protein
VATASTAIPRDRWLPTSPYDHSKVSLFENIWLPVNADAVIIDVDDNDIILCQGNGQLY